MENIEIWAQDFEKALLDIDRVRAAEVLKRSLFPKADLKFWSSLPFRHLKKSVAVGKPD